MTDAKELKDLARLVRYYILKMTTIAGSGHPSSSLSATDLAVALFFNKLRFDLDDVANIGNDRIIFSKGHVSPLIYALYTVAGAISEDELVNYRKFRSPLEGHPTANFKFAEAATGSLGQGLAVGLGMALAAKLDGLAYITYVLMGDSETAEGSVWEAIELASFHKLDNLVGIIDVNRLGQSGQTMLGHDVETYRARISAFGWETYVIDGHNLKQIVKTFEAIKIGNRKPKMIIAKTIKGKGVPFIEDKEGWHGKVLSAEDFEKAAKILGEVNLLKRGRVLKPETKRGKKELRNNKEVNRLNVSYKKREEIATRKAFGEEISKLGVLNKNIVSLDAEVKNSTFSELFKDKFPQRFFEMFIAEQAMVSAGLGLAKRGKIPFVSTFATFFTRAFDQIRMSAYSRGNVKFVGSHAGVSIGEDGPSQMGLEDFAMFRAVYGSVVLCPADAVATAHLVKLAAENEGIFYIRTSRRATPVIYSADNKFEVGGSKVVAKSAADKLTIVSCGITLFEAIKAVNALKKDGINVRIIDAYCIKPIDEKGLMRAASETNNKVVVVEDHYAEGGLGDAVLNVFAKDTKVQVYKLAVTKMPMSGKAEELLDYEGISSSAIVKKIKELTDKV